LIEQGAVTECEHQGHRRACVHHPAPFLKASVTRGIPSRIEKHLEGADRFAFGNLLKNTETTSKRSIVFGTLSNISKAESEK
jgi:hypothetical protein